MTQMPCVLRLQENDRASRVKHGHLGLDDNLRVGASNCTGDVDGVVFRSQTSTPPNPGPASSAYGPETELTDCIREIPKVVIQRLSRQ